MIMHMRSVAISVSCGNPKSFVYFGREIYGSHNIVLHKSRIASQKCILNGRGAAFCVVLRTPHAAPGDATEPKTQGNPISGSRAPPPELLYRYFYCIILVGGRAFALPGYYYYHFIAVAHAVINLNALKHRHFNTEIVSHVGSHTRQVRPRYFDGMRSTLTFLRLLQR